MNLIQYRRYPRTDFSNAWNQLSTLTRELDRVFDLDSFYRAPNSFHQGTPALDLYEDKDQFTVVIDLPGMKKEEIGISMQDGILTISGERKREEKQEGRFERFHGRFQRSITLPGNTDQSKVNASYQDGILKVVLPKAEEAKPKEIKISVE